jgi:hypothetical protein
VRLAGALAGRVNPRALTEREKDEAVRLAGAKYGTSEWLERF